MTRPDFVVLARWESLGGANWVEAHQDESTGFCSYASNSQLGNLGSVGVTGNCVRREDGTCWIHPDLREAEATLAVTQCQKKVDLGHFLPDRAKRAMRRII